MPNLGLGKIFIEPKTKSEKTNRLNKTERQDEIRWVFTGSRLGVVGEVRPR